MTIVRDRPIRVTYAALAVYGYVLYGLGPAFDALREELDTSRATIGLAGSAFAAGGVLAAVAGVPLARRARHGDVLRGALAAFALGLVGRALIGRVPGVVASAALMGVGGTMVLIVMPLVVEARRPAARSQALTEANFGATAAGILAPLAIGGATLAGIGWQTGLLVALVPITVVALLAGSATDRGGGVDAATPDHARLPGAFRRWWAAVIMVVAIEFCITFWAVDLLRDGAGMGQGGARAALGLFVGGMASGRLVGGRLASARDPQRLLVASLVVALAGFLVLWSAWAPAPALLGLHVTGCGVGLLFPMGLALAMDSAPGHAPLASARTALGSGTAVLVAPFMLAAVADAVGVRPAFGIVLGLILAALALAVPARDGGPAAYRVRVRRAPAPQR